MDINEQLVKFPAPEKKFCPECGSGDVLTKIEKESIPYGTGKEKVELNVETPVRECTACGFEYYDDGAEKAKHSAVCRHLGLMTPREVGNIRSTHGFSRAEFSQLTKIGEASVGRWERGALLQSAANDRYLFLLGFQENIWRLRDYNSTREKGMESNQNENHPTALLSKYRCLDESKVKNASVRAKRFELVRRAVS